MECTGLGVARARRSAITCVLCVFAFVAAATPALGALPADFERTALVTDQFEPTAIEFLPDGRMLIGRRDGAIMVYENGALLADPLISIPTDIAGGERGLLGLARHPDFADNGYLYVFYTTLEPRNRVARFTLDGNTADPASETLIWENPDLAEAYHHGGAILFANDGTLFISTGDQFSSSNSQEVGNQHGKILRVNDDGSLPADNPFIIDLDYEPEIWALGLRNPYRISYDGVTDTLYIGDVGGNGTTSWEEINVGIAGANYGWPNQEGDDCFVGVCSGITLPIYSFQHDDPDYFWTVNQGCITMGPRYRGDAMPEEYLDDLYIGDYANRWIRRIDLDAGGNVVGEAIFDSAPDSGTIVDLREGPDGALYYVTVGVAWTSGEPDGGNVYRISYIGDLNDPPVVVAAANPTQGVEPLEVEFTSAGSYDPDLGPGPLAYSWAFGDGATSAESDPTHTYAAAGMYDAVLTVSDGAGDTSAPPITIVAGNPPEVEITAPAAGTTYRAGDEIAFAATATDVEDGALAAAAFEWQVVLLHAAHAHPFYGPIAGIDSGSFAIPSTGHPPEDTYYEIRVTATDSDGLEATATATILPEIAEIVIDTVPSGILVFLDGEAELTPRVYASIPYYEHALSAMHHFVLDGVVYIFESWSDGGAQNHTYITPELGGSVTATYFTTETVVAAVDAPERNGDSYPPAGEELSNFYDGFGLCAGVDGGGVYQSGFQFALDVPPGAAIVDAYLTVTASYDQFGFPEASISAYDVGTAEPYDAAHTHALSAHHALTESSVSWSFGLFSPASEYDSPDLSPLVQEVIDRGDWSEGNYIGFVLDGADSPFFSWHCFYNYQSGYPATLTVSFLPPPEEPPAVPLFERGDCNSDGNLDIADAIFALVYLFSAGAVPTCLDACDLTDDESVAIEDTIYLLNYLFSSGPAPEPPIGDCGEDGAGAELLGCDSDPAC